MNELPPNLEENILDSHKRAADSTNPPFRSPPYTAVQHNIPTGAGYSTCLARR